MNMKTTFFKYVSQNILAMIGISCYILVDTFFIAKAAGANGITVLNLALPIYGLIFAIGAMVGNGSATRYAILNAQKNKEADSYFANSFIWLIIISIPFILIGILVPDKLLYLMGGDKEIVALGKGYTRVFLIFSPFFMLNYLFEGYVRNDNDPTRAMIATISGSFANIIFDYIFMFPMKMGIWGAALATSMSPLIGIIICCTHFLSPKNNLHFSFNKKKALSVKKLFYSIQLGVSAFVIEISSSVSITVFNFLLLGIAGNTGIAAYGIVANIALVATAIFNGITLGMQPLLSESFGKKEKKAITKYYKYGIIVTAFCVIYILLFVYSFTDSIIAIFNSEGSKELASLAHKGLRLYFPGYIFAGFNIISTGFFSSTGKAKEAFISSIFRGLFAIVITAVIMSKFMGITGIWLSFLVSETLCSVLIIFFLIGGKSNEIFY